jgi:hypothetical protein
MSWAKIGSENTLVKHLEHFKRIGLVSIVSEKGDNKGAIYEVRIIEEIQWPTHPQPPTPTHPPSDQKMGTLPTQNMGVGGYSQVSEDTSNYAESNTFFKTIQKTDDEAEQLWEPLHQVLGDITGKPQSWRRVGELLVAEYQRASSRTEIVSDPGAFMEAHLKRIFARRQGSTGTGKSTNQITPPTTIEEHVEQLHLLHQTDPSYSKNDMYDDLQDRCKRSKIPFNEIYARELIEKVWDDPYAS